VSNEVVTLDQMFRNDPRTIRYGQAENPHGYKEIEAFRAVRPSAGLARRLSKTVMTTFGRHFAMASTLFLRTSAPGKVGRMAQNVGSVRRRLAHRCWAR
jgi:hypothetical protein